jgi:glycosyltransferase involved in cell wall biosynthesis
VSLDVVGLGPQERNLIKLSSSLGLSQSVRFHGFMDSRDLERVRAQADVFALLPGDEPFGMVFPEAAAQGLVLLGPNHGGPGEMLAGGAFGVTVDAFHPAAFVEGLERCAAMTNSQVTELRERTFEAFKGAYSLEGYPARLQSLLDEAVRSS